jgi:hypothetical protein
MRLKQTRSGKSALPKEPRKGANGKSMKTKGAGDANGPMTSPSAPEGRMDVNSVPATGGLTQQTSGPANALSIILDIEHHYTDAEIDKLLSRLKIPSTTTWTGSHNVALISEMIRALTEQNREFRTLGGLWDLLTARLEERHGITKTMPAVQSQWNVNLRSLTGINEREIIMSSKELDKGQGKAVT